MKSDNYRDMYEHETATQNNIFSIISAVQQGSIIIIINRTLCDLNNIYTWYNGQKWDFYVEKGVLDFAIICWLAGVAATLKIIYKYC